MADFADKRDKRKPIAKEKRAGKQSERDIQSGAEAPSSQSKKESPVSRFGKLISDFRGGISALRGAITSLSGLGEGARAGKVSSHVDERAGSSGKIPPSAYGLPDTRAPSPASKVSRISQPYTSAPEVRSRQNELSALRRPEVAAKTPHVSRAPVMKSSMRKGVTRDKYSVVTGADAEAYRQVHASHVDPRRPAHMASAARLARILEAARLMESGSIEPHPQVQQWAKQVKSGDRRGVADLDPEYVHNVVISALGGNAAAERLVNTPEVQQLTSRHSSVLDRHRSEIRTLEKKLEKVRQEKEIRSTNSAPRAKPFQDRRPQMSPAYLPTAQSSALTPSPSRSADRHVSEIGIAPTSKVSMASMLSSNEEPHLAAATRSEKDRLNAEINSLTAAPTRRQAEERRVSATMPRSRTAPSPATLTSAQPGPSQIPQMDAAPRPPSGQTAAETLKGNTQSAGKQQQQLIQGELKLITASGQEIGVATMDAELT